MKNHVLRPLFVVIGIVVLILLARMVIVPKDFGIGERGYMYGWHRKSNEEDWKKFKVKYQGREYCKDCHHDKYDAIKQTPHAIIQCENCHGPANDAEGRASFRTASQACHRQEQGAVSAVSFPAALSHQRDGRRSGASIRTSIIRTSNALPAIIRTIRWRA